MAKISKGISVHDIDHIRTWYLSPDMLQEANDTVLAFTETLNVPKLFRANPDKNHTASDGQKFNLSVDSLNSGYSFKYFGLGRGVSRYSFVDESHRLFYTTVINASEREAAYVIDGLMHQEVIQHINFYGEYDFTEKPVEDEFNMDAIKALSVSITIPEVEI